VLSLTDVGEDLDEFDRAVEKLGLKGMTIMSNILGKPLDAPEFEPFWQRAVKHDIPLYIHPARYPYYPWIREHLLSSIFGWPFDTTIAMSRLVWGGVLERYPTLKFITHHLGGMVPYFVGRIQTFYDEGITYYPHMNTAPKFSKKHVLDYFRMFYNDTALYGWTPALQCGYEFFGADKILYGTDYPRGPEEGMYYLREALRSVNELKITPEEKEKILSGNARRILKIK
jgi:aminocarboxymuconate-semialdehyde decarboxylase